MKIAKGTSGMWWFLRKTAGSMRKDAALLLFFHRLVLVTLWLNRWNVRSMRCSSGWFTLASSTSRSG
jgi:hypothetical protein